MDYKVVGSVYRFVARSTDPESGWEVDKVRVRPEKPVYLKHTYRVEVVGEEHQGFSVYADELVPWHADSPEKTGKWECQHCGNTEVFRGNDGACGASQLVWPRQGDGPGDDPEPAYGTYEPWGIGSYDEIMCGECDCTIWESTNTPYDRCQDAAKALLDAYAHSQINEYTDTGALWETIANVYDRVTGGRNIELDVEARRQELEPPS